jgi:DNA-binding MarR family transcriptional regulator
LRTTQYSILAEVNRRSNDPPTVVELANALVLDRSALGHNLRPLERDGSLTLQESEKDRRRRHIVLSAHGKAKFKEAQRLWSSAQDRFMKVFGESEAVRLRATLLGIAYDQRLPTLKD